MENESTEYKEGSGDDFISFLFSSPPKDKNAIKLELSPPASDIQIGLHIFQELLMILTGGIQYLFGDNENKINISKMTEEQVNLLNHYFEFHRSISEEYLTHFLYFLIYRCFLFYLILFLVL